jgi:hypothetical protein
MQISWGMCFFLFSGGADGRDGDGDGAVLDAVGIHALLVRVRIRHNARLQRQLRPGVLGPVQGDGEVLHFRHERVEVEAVMICRLGRGDVGLGAGRGAPWARRGRSAAGPAGSERREAPPEVRGARARRVGVWRAALRAGRGHSCGHLLRRIRRHGEDRLDGAPVASHPHCLARQMLAVVSPAPHQPPAKIHQKINHLELPNTSGFQMPKKHSSDQTSKFCTVPLSNRRRGINNTIVSV